MLFALLLVPQALGHPETRLSSVTPQPAGFGVVVAGIGDVDGDGTPDLAIGDRDPRPDAWRPDPLWVISGANGRLLFRDPGVVLALSAAGDLNHDGCPDILVGGQDGARVLSGRDGKCLLTMQLEHTRHAGRTVDTLNDLDGDGRKDFLIVGDTRLGIFSSSNGVLLRSLEWTEPLSPFLWMGPPVCTVGDLNGDGATDIAVPYQVLDKGHELQVEILSSKTLWSILSIRPQAPGNSNCNGPFGTCVAPIEDVDRDGRPDVIVTWTDSWAGIYSGATGKLVRTFPELAPGGYLEGFGASAASLGDVNQDGTPDIAVGCAEDVDAGDQYYAAVFDGASGKVLRFIQQPDFPGKYHVVTSAGDLDGDGVKDLVVSIWEDSLVSVVSGRSFQVIREFRRPEVPARPR
jgi:hypothetical protein